MALAATSRFLSVYAIRLGATPVDLGWISSLPALFLLISASFAAWWTRRYGDPVRSLFLPGLGMRFLFLLPAFAPLLPIQWQPLWLIVSVTLPAVPQGIASVTFLSIMRDSVEPSLMTRLLSLRQLALNVAIGIAALAFGIWLEQAPFPVNYQIMFLLAFAFSLVSLWHCIRIRIVPKPAAPVAPVRTANVWRSKPFQRVAVAAAVIHIAFFTIVPVTPLFLVDRLGADEGYMAVFALLELSAGATASILAPRLKQRVGTRPMIAFSMIGTAVAAVVIAFAPNLYVALLAAVISGGCWTAGAGVGLFSLFVENAPEGEMTGYSTAYNQVIGLAIFVGPMVGSLLANSGVDLILVMAVGAVLRFIAAPLVESSLLSRWRSSRAPLPHPL
ncbi:MAG: MFS transporter [Anaerolineae bacterium]